MAVENVFASDVDATALRAACDEASAADDHGRARLLLRQLWSRHAGPAQAGFVSSRWPKDGAGAAPMLTRRVTVLRSFTVEPAVPLLRAGGLVNGLDLQVTVGGFNTYAQEIFDPSSDLYGPSAPDLVVLAVHTRDVAPDLWRLGDASSDAGGRRAAADRVSGELTSLIRSFRDQSTTPLIVHGLEVPTDLAMGLADAADEFGQRAAIERINHEVASAARDARCEYLDWDGLAASVGRAEVADESKWRSIRMPLSPRALVALADRWLRMIHPIVGRLAKVLVVDLDNTMWGGVVGEDGVDGLRLGEEGDGVHFLEVQRALLDIRSRGILLAVCSKNQAADGAAALDGHPEMLLRSDDFHALRINWSDKGTNLMEIAAELNLGIDSLAFLDDNPAERLLVTTNVPEVAVLPVTDEPASLAEAIRSSPLFERLALTSEDHRRSGFYTQERQRSQSREAAPSLESYLMSLDTAAVVGRARSDQLPRIAQLTQKTNQFNMTTRRYSEQDVTERHDSADWEVYALSASDRFGDHGLVAAALVERGEDAWRVDTLLMSCRVIGRDVESALIATIVDDASSSGANEVIGEFSSTAKNAPAQDFYSTHGFTDRGSVGEIHTWVRPLDGGSHDVPAWVTVIAADTDPTDRRDS